ncbi:transcriptional regulator, PadR family [Agromyces sp. CF514]|uniref:PadR family transcriptional regulator n=1 Tax=Agromyces sp. CF514 TaxID=1881031 RepID=UPI0008E22978|nr:PadR family transcriptional regulator [Agromyces sp. CF514]SFR85761.1 transcriptional regulator, PadR family [Agromyces sp. CF514]
MPPAANRRSPTALVVLATLTERPLHTYALHRLLQERGKTEVVAIPTRASLYPVLDRLERSGLIAVDRVEREPGRPERTVYRVTDLGASTVAEWLRHYLAGESSERPGFTAALSFAMLLPPVEVADALDRRRARLSTERSSLLDGLAAGDELGLPELFQLDERYRIAVLDADLAHLAELIPRLRAGELGWDREWIAEVAERLGAERPPQD